MSIALQDTLPFPPSPEETLDDLLIHHMTLLQSKKGYRFSLDAVLLAMWLDIAAVQKGMDLGTGSGVIPLLLTARKASLRMEGLEVQESLFQRAQKNIINNHLEDKIQILSGDIMQVPQQFPAHTYDLVCCNPPFFRAGEGKINPHSEKAVARHELKVTFEGIVQAARHLLRPGKNFALIFPTSRLSETLSLLLQNGFSPRRLRWVHPRTQAAATMFLLEASSGTKTSLTVEPPLFVYQEDGQYSPEIRAWYAVNSMK